LAVRGGGAPALSTVTTEHDTHAPTSLLANSATAVFVLAATGGLLLFLFRVQRQPVEHADDIAGRADVGRLPYTREEISLSRAIPSP
jgi:hypothetical protein